MTFSPPWRYRISNLKYELFYWYCDLKYILWDVDCYIVCTVWQHWRISLSDENPLIIFFLHKGELSCHLCNNNCISLLEDSLRDPKVLWNLIDTIPKKYHKWSKNRETALLKSLSKLLANEYFQFLDCNGYFVMVYLISTRESNNLIRWTIKEDHFDEKRMRFIENKIMRISECWWSKLT